MRDWSVLVRLAEHGFITKREHQFIANMIDKTDRPLPHAQSKVNYSRINIADISMLNTMEPSSESI